MPIMIAQTARAPDGEQPEAAVAHEHERDDEDDDDQQEDPTTAGKTMGLNSRIR
jgi:hypothetical protein